MLMSIQPASSPISHNAAALRCPSAALSPPAKTAAIQRLLWLSAGQPTA
jgi:hypothetical protein